jgi:demethylsterigmatocystin 6-O-methyltransferase
MESPLNQIREIYTKADASERHKIQDQIRSLQDELYTDWEVLFGQAIGVSSIFPIFLSSRLT